MEEQNYKTSIYTFKKGFTFLVVKNKQYFFGKFLWKQELYTESILSFPSFLFNKYSRFSDFQDRGLTNISKVYHISNKIEPLSQV